MCMCVNVFCAVKRNHKHQTSTHTQVICSIRLPTLPRVNSKLGEMLHLLQEILPPGNPSSMLWKTHRSIAARRSPRSGFTGGHTHNWTPRLQTEALHSHHSLLFTSFFFFWTSIRSLPAHRPVTNTSVHSVKLLLPSRLFGLPENVEAKKRRSCKAVSEGCFPESKMET